MTARLSLRARLARVHPFVWLAVVAVAGGLIAWPLGGWQTVELESTKIPQVAPGVVVTGQQYSVEVDSAELTDLHPNGYTETVAGWEWLVMTVGITNETDMTTLSFEIASDYYGVLTVDDSVLGWNTTTLNPDGYVVDSDNYLIADGTYNPDLQPGLPARLTLVFPVKVGTWTVGDTLTVGIVDRTPYEKSLSTGIGWRDPTVIATVQVPVEQGTIAPDAIPDEGAVP